MLVADINRRPGLVSLRPRAGACMTHVPDATYYLDARLDFAMDDITLARALNGLHIPHWSEFWPRIGDLQRKGLLRVTALSRYMAEATAIGEAHEWL